MFVQALHIDAAREFSKIGVRFNPGQYVFNDQGEKGRILASDDGHVAVCWKPKYFRDIYRQYYLPSRVKATFYFAEHQETMTLYRSELEEAEEYLTADHGECYSIKVKSC